jgi:hypothetical protein
LYKIFIIPMRATHLAHLIPVPFINLTNFWLRVRIMKILTM